MDASMIAPALKDMGMDTMGTDIREVMDVDVDEVVVDIMKDLDHMSENMEVRGLILILVLIHMIVERNIRAANSKI